MHDRLGEFLAGRRVRAVLPHVRGRLLDIGCGYNNLVRQYFDGVGVGVDVHPWPGVDRLVDDAASLEWDAHSFDTITIVAALNHMPNRKAVLQEAWRLLKPDGRVVVTMLTPRISRVWHWARAPWDTDQCERQMKTGEVYGFTSAQVIGLFQSCGFALESRQRFMLGFNHMYIFRVVPSAQFAADRVDKKTASLVGAA
jgi:SAM-dependent methyltransferase